MNLKFQLLAFLKMEVVFPMKILQTEHLGQWEIFFKKISKYHTRIFNLICTFVIQVCHKFQFFIG